MLYGNKPANLRHFRLFFLHNALSTTYFYPFDNSSGPAFPATWRLTFLALPLRIFCQQKRKATAGRLPLSLQSNFLANQCSCIIDNRLATGDGSGEVVVR
jgi:hypothetical protein